MPRHRNSLLSQLETAALAKDTSVPDALRLCIALGGRSGSSKLRDWASRELNGYDGVADLPDYRRVAAALRIDAVKGNQFVGGGIIRGQRISPSQLPDVVAQHIKEEVQVRQPIAEIEKLARSSESVKLSLPMGGDVARLMTHGLNDPLAAVTEVYWSIAPSSLHSVVDRVRTKLVQLTSEIRSGLGESDEGEVPSSDLADHAVSVVIYGNSNQVVMHSPRLSGSGPSSNKLGNAIEPQGKSWLRWTLTGLVGLSTVAGAVFAGIQLFL